MTRFFIDTEFIENGSTIDLISIGIVSEDGEREYYAINYDCDWSKADDWVKENVLKQLPEKPLPICYGSPEAFHNSEFYKQGWRNKGLIAEEIIKFCNPKKYSKVQFYGYYSSYDHVTVAQLFGKMIDLPKGFPMYTRDIKQTLDELGNPKLPKQKKGNHNALDDAKWIRDSYLLLKQNYQHPAFN